MIKILVLWYKLSVVITTTMREIETPAWSELRELAAVTTKKEVCVSLYLQIKGRSRLSDGAHALFVDLKRGGNFNNLTEEISSFLDTLDMRGIKTLAVFAKPESIRAFWLPEPVDEQIFIDKSFIVAPMIPMLEHTRDTLVVFVGREQGRLLRLRRGRIEALDTLEEPIRRRHNQGGWSQANYQRSIDNDYYDHLNRLADLIELESLKKRRPIIIVGNEESKGAFEPRLKATSLEYYAGCTHIDTHTPVGELIKIVDPLLEKWLKIKEISLLNRWQEAVGKGVGASGWADTLAAACAGRIQCLLYNPGSQGNIWCCPRCGQTQTTAGKCPFDGKELDYHQGGLELAIHQTFRYGGKIWALRQNNIPEDIGALLRF